MDGGLGELSGGKKKKKGDRNEIAAGEQKRLREARLECRFRAAPDKTEKRKLQYGGTISSRIRK